MQRGLLSIHRSCLVTCESRYASSSVNNNALCVANDNCFGIIASANARDSVAAREPRVAPRESFHAVACPSLVLRAFVARNAPLERFVRCADRSSLRYVFDSLGNLTQRQDTVEGATENFCYNGLNRLVNYALGGTPCTTGTAGLVKSVSYCGALGFLCPPKCTSMHAPSLRAYSVVAQLFILFSKIRGAR